MKCPKCQYISFDDPVRCRHCGYDFGGSAEGPAAVDAPLRDREAPEGPLPELSLRGRPGAAAPTPSRTPGGLDLPLFNEPVPGLDDTPLISSPAPPRAPLAVRRASAEPSSRMPRADRAKPARPSAPARPTPRPAADTPEPTQLWAEAPDVSTAVGELEATATPVASARAADPAPGDAASPGARLGALVVDAVLLGVIDVAVVQFTLSILRYPWSRALELPLLPLVAFLVMLNAGYLVLLTAASGQTLGKMLTGIRVVSSGAWRVPVTQAAMRAALALLSLLTLGLGYLPALAGSDRRALHDRLSNTRVVRA